MRKLFFNLSAVLILCTGFYSCSSDNNDNNTYSQPTGNWYGSDTKSGWSCGAQFETYKINSKDSTLCTLTIEDVTDAKTYTMIGNISFNKNTTTITFPKTTDGPTQATLVYNGSDKLDVTIVGGNTKYGEYIISKNTSNLTSIAGQWNGNSCTASFSPYTTKGMTATLEMISSGTTINYSGAYTYDKLTGKGTFTDSATKTAMTFSIATDSKTNVTTLTIVNGTTTYTMNRYVFK